MKGASGYQQADAADSTDCNAAAYLDEYEVVSYYDDVHDPIEDEPGCDDDRLYAAKFATSLSAP